MVNVFLPSKQMKKQWQSLRCIEPFVLLWKKKYCCARVTDHCCVCVCVCVFCPNALHRSQYGCRWDHLSRWSFVINFLRLAAFRSLPLWSHAPVFFFLPPVRLQRDAIHTRPSIPRLIQEPMRAIGFVKRNSTRNLKRTCSRLLERNKAQRVYLLEVIIETKYTKANGSQDVLWTTTSPFCTVTGWQYIYIYINIHIYMYNIYVYLKYIYLYIFIYIYSTYIFKTIYIYLSVETGTLHS